jgi:hypothetical protein
MAGLMFELNLPPVEALIFMKGREREVKTEVQHQGLMEYKSSYTTGWNNDLLTLLCNPAASAFVRMYWAQHHTKKGTPMTRQDGTSFEPLHELLSKTSSVVRGVLQGLGVEPVARMDTKLPPGVYLYAIGFDGEAVIKVGKVKIHDPAAPPQAEGKRQGSR